jgi:hypothetical protein
MFALGSAARAALSEGITGAFDCIREYDDVSDSIIISNSNF